MKSTAIWPNLLGRSPEGNADGFIRWLGVAWETKGVSSDVDLLVI